MQLRHARRGRPHHRRRRTLRSRLRPGHRGRRQGSPRGPGHARPADRPRRLGQAVRPVAPLRGGPGGARLGRAVSAGEASRRARRRLRHQFLHGRRGGGPAGPVAQAARPPRPRSGPGRMEGARPRRPGLSEARARGHRPRRRSGAYFRPPPHGAPGQGRLLGHRDQARPGHGPTRLSGVHHQGRHRRQLSGLRPGHHRRQPAPVRPVRHPQRRLAGGHPPYGAAGRRRRGIPAPARHGRAALRRRRGRLAGREADDPRLRPRRRARGAAALSGPPPARERRQLLLRPRPARRAGPRLHRRLRSRRRPRKPARPSPQDSGPPAHVRKSPELPRPRLHPAGRPRAPRRRPRPDRPRKAQLRPDRQRRPARRREPDRRHQPVGPRRRARLRLRGDGVGNPPGRRTGRPGPFRLGRGRRRPPRRGPAQHGGCA